MHQRVLTIALAVAGLTVAAPLHAEDGVESLFDGKTLEGWNGDPKFWTVEDGAITGRTTPDNPTKGNTFIIWDGEVADFELTLDYKIVGGNSGIQYRSFKLKGADEWRIGGYQADIDSKETYSGIVYGEKARGILCGRGERCTIAEGGKKQSQRFAESAAIQAKIKKEDWNSYRIVAEGNHLVQYINGVKTAELIDNDVEGEGKRMAKGLLALQLHAGPPMTVQFKNIKLKTLGKRTAALPRPVQRPAGNPALRTRIDQNGTVETRGRLIGNLATALAPVANDVLANGVVAEYRYDKERCGEKVGEETIRLTASGAGATLESEHGRVDVTPDGRVRARSGQFGLDYADGRARLSFLGITAFEFGADAAKPDPAAEVPDVDLGEPGDVDLGSDGALEGASAETLSTGGFVFAETDPKLAKLAVRPKKIVFIAGRQSHGYGAHEHKAGCMLLADQLDKSGLPVETHVVTNGWPQDASILDDADCIVVYADGGPRHPFNDHIEELDKLADKGVGIVCIHYGVEVPKGKSGDAFLDWTGGYFEENWSVNPHWEADYAKLPKHPTTRGVKPFKVNDEWYYHMRFREEGVTPILTDLPPKSTLVKPDGSLARPDNAHNNNPHVRKAVLERMEPQHMAWAREREDGGRGFGITGGHFHWNWGNDQMRKLMLNAVVWSANLDVPDNGVPTQPVTVKDLMANQDYDAPKNFNPARYEEMLKQWNAGS